MFELKLAYYYDRDRMPYRGVIASGNGLYSFRGPLNRLEIKEYSFTSSEVTRYKDLHLIDRLQLSWCDHYRSRYGLTKDDVTLKFPHKGMSEKEFIDIVLDQAFTAKVTNNLRNFKYNDKQYVPKSDYNY